MREYKIIENKLRYFIFEVNEDKFNKPDKLRKQIEFIKKRIINKHNDIVFIDSDIGYIEDNFIRNKITLRLRFADAI